jgi:hypothetical protein
MTMTLSEVLASFNRLFVVNTAGNIEADLVNTTMTDFANSVTFLPTPAPPQIRSFTVQNQETTVDAGATIVGPRTFDFVVTNTPDVTGTLTFEWNAVALDTTISASATSTTQTIPSTTLSAGQTATARLSGVDKDTNTFERSLVFTARNLDDYLYYGPQPTNDATNFDFANESRTPFQAGTQSFNIPSFSGSEHFVIAQKSGSDDFDEIMIDGIDQSGAFTITRNAFTVNANEYDAWVSNNLFNSTMIGEKVTVVR